MRHRKNYRSALKWSLAALILIIALPFVLGIANAWNESIAAQELVAFELNSDNDTIAQPTENPNPYRIAAFVDDGTLHQAEQSVFWDANESWDEIIIQTGATTADNTSNKNRIYINWNISAQDLVNANVNKIVIALKGVNANTTIRYSAKAINNGYEYSDSTNAINLLDINNIYMYKTISLNNTNSATITITLDPAMLKYAADHTLANNSHIGISLSSNDPANDFFSEGQVIYFRIYAERPHGRFVVNGVDFVDGVAEIYGIVFIFAAVFATGAVNPTKKHVFGGLYYGLKRYAKIRRKQKYRRARARYYGNHRRYYRRWY